MRNRTNSRTKKFLIIGGVLILVLASIAFYALSSDNSTGLAVRAAKPQCSDGKDNDVDGLIDYKFDRRTGTFIGDPDCTNATDNSESCSPLTEVCDGKDNDCDAQIDEELTRQCGQTDVGACSLGTETCTSGSWGNCFGVANPTTEVCNGVDDDCDGTVDDGWSIVCNSDEQCGTPGWFGSPYCKTDGDLYSKWVSYQCNFPATCSSNCTSIISEVKYQDCYYGCSGSSCLPQNQNNTNSTGY